MPFAVAVAELEVGPRPKRRVRGQQSADEVEPLGLMCELGRGYLNPALNALRHGPVSFMCPHGLPAGAEVSPASILPVTTVKWGRRSSSLARTATSSDARDQIGTVGLPASAARVEV